MNRTRYRISLISLTALLAATAAFGQGSTPDTFATFRGDVTHVGFVDTPIAANLALQWQFTRPSWHGNTSSPVVTKKAVIFGLGQHVYAVSTDTGALIWQYPKEGDDVSQVFNCPPAYAEGKVYIGNDDGNLYALDAATGSVVWKNKSTAFVHTAPVVVEGIVYYSAGAALNAADAATGKAVWGSPVQTQSGIITSPVVANDDIYVVDGSGTLYASTVLSGRPLWNTRISGSPVADGALVYDHSSLFFRDGHILKVISGRGGDAKGQIDMNSEIIGPITVTDDGSYIVTTTDLKVTSLDGRGRKMWSTALGDFPSSPPLATRFHLFVTTNSGVIYELDRATGAIKWTYTMQAIAQKAGTTPAKNASIYAAPVVANHTLYVLSDDGTLSAFRESAPDNLLPVVSALYPGPDATISGKAIPYQVQVADTGSGVRPDTVSLVVDGKPIPVDYDVNSTKVHVKYQTGDLGMGLPVTLDSLIDGKHSATFTCTDWRGNKLTRSWNFKVDKSRDSLAVSTTPVPVNAASQSPAEQASGASAPANSASGQTGAAGNSTMPATQHNVQQANGGQGGAVQSAQPGQTAQPTQVTQPSAQPTQVAPAPPSPPVKVSVPSTGDPTPPPAAGPGTGPSIQAGTQGGPPPPPPI